MVNNVSVFFLFLMPWAMVNLENPGKRLKHVQWVFFLKVQRPDDASSSTSSVVQVINLI